MLDALRGFALLGILVSHIPTFSGYEFLPAAQQASLDALGVDRGLAALCEFLIRGKFFSLFSLLFGIGFSVQLESASRRGATRFGVAGRRRHDHEGRRHGAIGTKRWCHRPKRTDWRPPGQDRRQ